MRCLFGLTVDVIVYCTTKLKYIFVIISFEVYIYMYVCFYFIFYFNFENRQPFKQSSNNLRAAVFILLIPYLLLGKLNLINITHRKFYFL
jgi:hypothetical protein